MGSLKASRAMSFKLVLSISFFVAALGIASTTTEGQDQRALFRYTTKGDCKDVLRDCQVSDCYKLTVKLLCQKTCLSKRACYVTTTTTQSTPETTTIKTTPMPTPMPTPMATTIKPTSTITAPTTTTTATTTATTGCQPLKEKVAWRPPKTPTSAQG